MFEEKDENEEQPHNEDNAADVSSNDDPADKGCVRCKKCDKTFAGPYQYAHVMTVHILKMKVFCFYCGRGDKYNVGNIKSHMRRDHKGKKVKIIDKRQEFSEEAQEMLRICFPNSSRKVRRRSSRIRPSVLTLASENNTDSSDEEPPAELSYNEDEQPTHKQSPGHCNLCDTKCDDSFHSRRKHVARHHVNFKKFGCPQCRSGGTMKRYVEEHIKLKHADAKDARPVDNAAKFRIAVTEAMKRCFLHPHRPTRRLDENKVECQLCARVLKKTHASLKYHVLATHVPGIKRRCPYCDYGTTYNAQAVREHIRTQHEGKAVNVLNKVGDFREEYFRVRKECFPGLSYSRGPKLQKKQLPKTRANLKTYQVQCQKCTTVLNNRGSIRCHILAAHVPGVKVRCPYCDFGTTGNIQTVQGHIRAQHEGSQVRVINKLQDYRQDYLRERNECFPAKAWKKSAVKPNGSAKNRYDTDRYRTFVQCKQCKVTFQNSAPSREKHIFKEHIKQFQYTCSYCPDFGRYTDFIVRAHILSQHPTENTECIDRRGQFEPQLTDLIDSLLEPVLQPPPKLDRSQPKAGHGPFCRVCRIHICGNASTHIQQFHLGVETIRCGHCGKGDKGRQDNIKVHSAQKHRHLPLAVEDRRPWFQPLIKMHYYRCFADNGTYATTASEFELD